METGLIRERMEILGMTCISCQDRVTQVLEQTPGIKTAKVSYRTGTADIVYDPNVIDRTIIRSVIAAAGYQAAAIGTRPGRETRRTIGILLAVVCLYFLLERGNILNLLVPGQLADSSMGYGMLFITGLITSVHCLAMCGGINLSQCLPKDPEQTPSGPGLRAFRPALLYNAGRLISYAGTGFLFGLAGMMIGGGASSGLPVFLQGCLKLIAGAVMVIMGLNMLGIFPWLRRFSPAMPKLPAAWIRSVKRRRQSLIVGLLNGLMPCGPLQSMQIVALASASPWTGALSMFVFSLGTVPLMLGFGSAVLALGKRFSRTITTAGAVLVVVLGLAMLSQGGSLSGLLSPDVLLFSVIVLGAAGVIAEIPFSRAVFKAVGIAVILLFSLTAFTGLQQHSLSDGSPAQAATADTAARQVIESTLSYGRYPVITVQSGIPVEWTVDVPDRTLNGCNYKIFIPEYGIEYTFQPGKNLIEFTPENAGVFQYSCWMGMIRGTINVTDGSVAADAAEFDPAPLPAAGGSCCD